MGFEIVRSDITAIRADAIVNTANPEPVIGFGTDSAVHAAAGPKLLKARQKIGAIAVGESASTRAFDLPAKYVLHTVSPMWLDGQHGEPELLYRAYTNTLRLAKKLRCRSVAFPLLAAGSYGFPHEVALKTAIRAFTDFLLETDLCIILAVFDKAAFSLAGSLFDYLKSYIDDRCAEEKAKAEYPQGLNDRRLAREAMLSGQARPCVNADTATFDAPIRAEAAKAAAPRRQAQAYHQIRLEDVLKETESSFSEHLLSLLKECGEKDSDVYRRAQISRQLFNKIVNKKDYQPTKSTAIQLALALRLDLDGTQKLLRKAGYSLTRSNKTDLVVQYFIERKEFNVLTINAALFDCGLPLLKTGSAS